MQSSLQPSSIPTYRRAWRLYTHFSNRVLNSSAISLPLSPSNLGLFISFMFDKNYACSTALTYVSALGYCHRLAGRSDPTKVFWVLEMLKGYTKMGMRVDTRLPITLPILLKGGDRRVRRFSAHNSWWATPEVSLLLPYQRSAKVFLNFLRQGVKTMYYF